MTRHEQRDDMTRHEQRDDMFSQKLDGDDMFGAGAVT